jgi:2'-5' RNA ligase superfamily
MKGVGFTDEITADELGHLDHALTATLAEVEPPMVEFRALTIQQEAVYLKAHPVGALALLRRAARDAVLSVLGPERFTKTPAEVAKWLPHVSIDYITYDGDPTPIATALDILTTRTVPVTFAKADFLEFHRDNCMYEWASAAPLYIRQ